MTWHQSYSFVGVQGADLSGCNKPIMACSTEILCLVLSSTFLIHVEAFRLHLIFRGTPLNKSAGFFWTKKRDLNLQETIKYTKKNYLRKILKKYFIIAN
jgi:hypothetical protein